MKKAKSGNLESVIYGAGTIMIAALLLTIPATFLIMGGVLPQNAMMLLGLIVTAIASFSGGCIAAKKAVKSPLPMALVSAGIYLLAGFVVRGLLFGGVAEQPWWVILVAVVAAIAGSMAAAGKKQRVKHRI